MTLRVLAAADRQAAPWKNGGGVTREIALYPAGSDMETFEWRASTAIVAADGPFSFFAGVERTLAVLEGDGLELRIDGALPVRLGPDHDPITFPGDVPAAARLVGGPVTDLNIMTRRGAWSARLQRRNLGAAAQLAAKADSCLILVLDACEVGAARSVRQLAPGDALLLAQGDGIDLAPRRAAARILVVELLRCRRTVPPLAEQADG